MRMTTPGCGNPEHAQPCRPDPETGRHWFQSTGIPVSPPAGPGRADGEGRELPRAVPAVGPDGPVTLILGDPDPGDWDLTAQLPGPLARVRADVAAAKTARTEDLIAQILAELREVRAELAALNARDTEASRHRWRTPEEFEGAYAARSGITVAQLRAAGRIVVPCDCGEDDCEGWASVSMHLPAAIADTP